MIDIKTINIKMEELVTNATDTMILLALVGLGVLLTILFLACGYPQGAAISVFGAVTSIFSFFAFRAAQEKFRLDLFEKRWEVYENILEFCSIVTRHGGAPKDEKEIEKMIEATNESFNGIGWHRVRLLFGEDIQNACNELRESFAWLITIGKVPLEDRRGNSEYANWGKERMDHVMRVYNRANGLPSLFSPYLYFGDYKVKVVSHTDSHD